MHTRQAAGAQEEAEQSAAAQQTDAAQADAAQAEAAQAEAAQADAAQAEAEQADAEQAEAEQAEAAQAAAAQAAAAQAARRSWRARRRSSRCARRSESLEVSKLLLFDNPLPLGPHGASARAGAPTDATARPPATISIFANFFSVFISHSSPKFSSHFHGVISVPRLHKGRT